MANEIKIVVNADTKNATSKLENFKKSARRTGLALGAMGAAGTLAIKSFVGAALEQERAMKTLGSAVENTGVNFESVRGNIERTTAALQAKTNFGDEQQMRVLARMVPILGDVDKAMEALPLVMDAASASGLGVESVAGTLSRALSGMVNTSESIGVTFDENATFSERLAIGFGKVGGAAEANADPMIQMGNALGDMKETIGAALLPVILPLIERITALAEAAQTMNPRIFQIGAGLLAAATAVGVLSGAITLLMSASGIGLVVVALGALFIAWQTNFGGIQDITANAINFMREKFGGFFNTMAGWLNKLIKGFNAVFRTNIPPIEEMVTKVKELAEAAKETVKEFVFPKQVRTDLIASGIHIDQNKKNMKEFKEETNKATESINEQTKAMVALVSGGTREAAMGDIFDKTTTFGASQALFGARGVPIEDRLAGMNLMGAMGRGDTTQAGTITAEGVQALITVNVNVSGNVLYDAEGTATHHVDAVNTGETA